MKKEKIYTLLRLEYDYESTNELDLITVREKDKEKLEKLLEKVTDYENKKSYISNLSNYIRILSNDADQRKNPKIMISDFIMKEIITTPINLLYYLESFLEYLFILDIDLNHLIFNTKDEDWFRFRFNFLNKDDIYDKEINYENGVDWDKFKRTLLAYSKYHAKNILKIREFCLKNQYDKNIYDNYSTIYGRIREDDYNLITSKKMDRFFEGIENYDINILPTVESYIDDFISYFKNHPLSPYTCTLHMYLDSIHEDSNCLYNIKENEIIDEL